MTNFDSDDQPIPPLRTRRRRRILTTDRVLTAAGMLVAAASAVFPWYIFLNPEKFRIVSVQQGMSRVLPNWPGRAVVAVSPAAIPNSNPRPKEILPLDQLITASTPISVHVDRNVAAQDQPFPGTSSFRLLHVANGRVLIEDKSGLYMVQVGSVLPDQSRLAAIEQHEGKWLIRTTKGVVSQE